MPVKSQRRINHANLSYYCLRSADSRRILYRSLLPSVLYVLPGHPDAHACIRPKAGNHGVPVLFGWPLQLTTPDFGGNNRAIANHPFVWWVTAPVLLPI